ncbi:MAG: hypothetical protein JO264_13330 [Acidisphaera sp.]|nr:hypothetical protein [Acidisphaera sp.]
MDGATLQDRIYRGLGTAARAIGVACDAFRPCGPNDPIAPANRFLRLNAAFNAQDPHFEKATPYGAAVWYGVFDAAYTRPGDYLVEQQSGAASFIAAQQRLLPVLCVRAPRIVSFERAAAPVLAGVNSYGGVTQATATPLLRHWPASMIAAGGIERSDALLPADTRLGSFTVLLPAWPGVTLRPADLMTDDIGRTCVVSVAELTELGWRLTVRQAAT